MADTEPTPRGLENRIPPPLIFLAIAVAMGVVAQVLPPSDLAGTTSLALAIALFLLAGFAGPPAIARFRRAGTTINPVEIERASVLVTDGIYRWTRNPMYLSMAALLGAIAAYTAQPWLLLGPVIFVLFITRFQILPEERAMQARFGEAYSAYRARVRRWL